MNRVIDVASSRFVKLTGEKQRVQICFFIPPACYPTSWRLAKDFEATIDSARAFLYVASVMLLVRRMRVLHDFRNRRWASPCRRVFYSFRVPAQGAVNAIVPAILVV